jgi:hypothetical protein
VKESEKENVSGPRSNVHTGPRQRSLSTIFDLSSPYRTSDEVEGMVNFRAMAGIEDFTPQ